MPLTGGLCCPLVAAKHWLCRCRGVLCPGLYKFRTYGSGSDSLTLRLLAQGRNIYALLCDPCLSQEQAQEAQITHENMIRFILTWRGRGFPEASLHISLGCWVVMSVVLGFGPGSTGFRGFLSLVPSAGVRPIWRGGRYCSKDRDRRTLTQQTLIRPTLSATRYTLGNQCEQDTAPVSQLPLFCWGCIANTLV